MQSGGNRTVAGRPKKAAIEKMLNGNPGKPKIEVVNFDHVEELLKNPATWLKDKGKEIYKTVHEWLAKIGYTKGILPCHFEEYAHCKAR